MIVYASLLHRFRIEPVYLTRTNCTLIWNTSVHSRLFLFTFSQFKEEHNFLFNIASMSTRFPHAMINIQKKRKCGNTMETHSKRYIQTIKSRFSSTIELNCWHQKHNLELVTLTKCKTSSSEFPWGFLVFHARLYVYIMLVYIAMVFPNLTHKFRKYIRLLMLLCEIS